MAGSHYIALSGLRARMDELDRLASDIANVGTAGYKGERQAQASADRPSFDAALQTAVDTTFGGRQLDVTAGAIEPTGRPLDVALDGPGFIVVNTAAGPRYTRNGHFTLDANRQLITEDGATVQGLDGPITAADGDLRIDEDGTVWAGLTRAGRLSVVEFADPRGLVRDQGNLLRADAAQPVPAEKTVVRAGALEESNVSMAERLAELTTVSRGFEALQKAISMLMNDVDGRAIDALGRR